MRGKDEDCLPESPDRALIWMRTPGKSREAMWILFCFQKSIPCVGDMYN